MITEAQLRQNWLDSLSCPFPEKIDYNSSSNSNCSSDLLNFHGNGSPNLGSEWVIGVDPDASGALALLKPDHSAQVWRPVSMYFLDFVCSLVNGMNLKFVLLLISARNQMRCQLCLAALNAGTLFFGDYTFVHCSGFVYFG